MLHEVPAELDAAALAKLEKRAKEEKSTGLIVLHGGKLLREEYFGFDSGPQNAMSVTKSVVALLIGALVDDGRLKLDEPLGERLFPEWKKKPQGEISLRQLMHHTSGLDTQRFYQNPKEDFRGSIERHVLSGKLSSKPGTRWGYNNNATDFLSVVVRRASSREGRPFQYLDDLLTQRILEPLGAVGASWGKDGRGDARVSGELWLRPLDLAKVGQLVLDEGQWRGKQLVSKDYLEQMVAAGPMYSGYGLLWWRSGRGAGDFKFSKHVLPKWKKAGVSAEVLEKLKTLDGKRWKQRAEAEAAAAQALGGETELKKLQEQLWGQGRALFARAELEVLAYRADGYLGQYIIVIPSKRLVCVRMRDGAQTSWKPDEYGYSEFLWDALAVAGYDLHPKDRRQ